MAFTESQLSMAGDLLRSACTLHEAVTLWRERHPKVRAMLLDAADLRSETPVLRQGRRSVYLVATQGHCWHVTQRPEEADALILSQD
ncbi:MAG TPA: hypothetical protein VMS38_32525 [Pseudorhodoferax sp.]|nr:hypothetical protein [Pseudorhodoferax sp.]